MIGLPALSDVTDYLCAVGALALSDEVERLRAAGASITEEELERRLDVLRKKMAESGGFNETGSAVFRCIACNRALPEQAKWKLDRDEAQFMAHRDVRQVRSLARMHADAGLCLAPSYGCV